MRHAIAVLGVGLGLLTLGAACGGESAASRSHSGDRGAHQGAQPLSASVRFLGRYDATDPQRVRFAWSASGAAARFRGTRIDARLRDEAGTNFFQIIVDGTPTTTLALPAGHDVVTLASGLRDGEHEIAIVKRTEARVGEVEFQGFVVPDGTLLAPPPLRGRKIELVGDSITAGYGNEGLNQHCRFSPTTENEFMTYGAIAARTLGAEHATVAWSGRTIEGISEVYDRALPARSESRWDARAFVPDVVVINLGTNDVTRGDQQDAFVASYEKLIARVRAQYPSALIVCAVGPMLTDTYPPGKLTLTRARRYVQAAVANKKRAGEAKIVYLEFPTQSPETGYGCDYHPSLATHEQMAGRLAALLRAELGW